MRSIDAKLTPELARVVDPKAVDLSPSLSVRTYRQLVEQVAKLSYLNKDHLLFFRGQAQDYKNKAGASSFYPTIYRGDYVPQGEIRNRFKTLKLAERYLSATFKEENVDGHRELARKKHIRWSILQHYGVCNTPLLDFTHSLRVACSFAQRDRAASPVFVYVFGLPYITNRISVNSEHDIVIVRLLSICPPDALRPYFQEGYLAGTEDITSEYESKTELDFRNRLIAKFAIPNSKRFWGRAFSKIPDSILYPKADRVESLCEAIAALLR